MTEVHFQLFTLKKLYIFGVEDDSLCIYCQENESTMYLVDDLKKSGLITKMPSLSRQLASVKIFI